MKKWHRSIMGRRPPVRNQSDDTVGCKLRRPTGQLQCFSLVTAAYLHVRSSRRDMYHERIHCRIYLCIYFGCTSVEMLTRLEPSVAVVYGLVLCGKVNLKQAVCLAEAGNL